MGYRHTPWYQRQVAARISEVARRTLEGHSSREIAEQLGLSERQVVRDRAFARDNGWFEEIS